MKTLQGAICLLALALQSAAAAPVVHLASYRAVYDLSLGSAETSSGIVDLRGRLVLQWSDTCEGYVFDQRIRTEMVLQQGGAVTSDFIVNSWESADGKRFRFSLKHRMNGKVVEAYRGRAELGELGRPGKIVYSVPEGRQETLPPGVVFPTEHNRILVQGALAGEHFVVVEVFDGSGDDGLNRVTAVLGARLPPESGDDAIFQPLKGLAAWPARLAFHKLDESKQMPTYEIGFRLFENGVPSHVSLEYSDFSIAGKMTQVKILPDPGC